MPTTVWGFLTCHSIKSTHWKEKERAALTGIVIAAWREEMQFKVLIQAILPGPRLFVLI